MIDSIKPGINCGLHSCCQFFNMHGLSLEQNKTWKSHFSSLSVVFTYLWSEGTEYCILQTCISIVKLLTESLFKINFGNCPLSSHEIPIHLKSLIKAIILMNGYSFTAIIS